MNNLKDMATKQVLLELRKKINRLIADQQMEDPEAAAEGEAEADEALGDLGADAELEGAEDLGAEVALGEEPEEEEDELRATMRDYMNPKPKERRPGTAMMIATESKKPAKNKGQFGKLTRREAV